MRDSSPAFLSRALPIFNRALEARHATRGLTMKKGPDSADLLIYDVIGEDFWTGGGVTAKTVAAELKKCEGVKTLNIYINSPGGEVFEGEAIYNQLRRFDATKVVTVDGLAASAASFIAMAGDTVKMGKASQMMIHKAMGGLYIQGFADEITAAASSISEILNLLTDTIAGIYADRTGKPVADMLALMEAETWMDPARAVELGLADEVVDGEAEPDEDDKPAALATPAALAHTQSILDRLPAMRREAKLRNIRIAASLDADRASPAPSPKK